MCYSSTLVCNVGDLDEISKICKNSDIYLIEDAAQAPASFTNPGWNLW